MTTVTAPAGAILQVADACKSFGGVAALSDCSIDVREHSITGLIGPNGSGKTTLFNVISGFIPPDRGGIQFAGAPITGMVPGEIYKRGLGRTFQMARVFPRLTALENLLVPVRRGGLRGLIGGFTGDHERTRALEMLGRLGIDHVADERAGRLSYGQRRLVEMGTLMMSRPSMVLLDEPVAGVHPRVVSTLASYIQEARDQQVTFLIVEHNLNFVMDVCDRVFVLDRGTTIAEGPPDEVRASKVVIDAYLGD